MNLIGRLVLRRNRSVDPPVQHSAAPATLSQGEFPVLEFDSLIERTGTRDLFEALRPKLGFPPEMFDASVRPVIAVFAEFVQLLPASESHHHAEPGGLFAHTMEVVSFALDYRRGQILPKGAPPEAIGEQAHRWTYAVFVAALLHDVGKPIADLRVYLRKGASGSEPWSPLAGSIAACGATSYRVEFAARESRQYELHARLPVLLLNRFVPSSILGWLSADSGLIRELFSHLSGEKGAQEGMLHQLVSRGDAESVRRNLLSGSRVRFASARRVPLIEQLMQALRTMLREGGRLPLNRSGAAGWVYGGDIWFVSKRLADEVRAYLVAAEPVEDGIPRDNQRLFDTWQEYGAAVPNPRTGGAVWDVLVIGPGYEHALTVLRFPLSVLFERAELYPATMQGRIEIPERKPSTREAEERGAAKPAIDEAESAIAQPEEYLEAVDERTQARTDSAMPDSIAAAPMLRPAVTPAWLGPEGSTSQAGEGVPEAALRFMGWVQEGLASGRLRFNESGALVHFVPEGMLLVSPRVFREFAKVHGEDGRGAAAADEAAQPGKGVQRQVLRAGWHVRADKGVNILTYHVVRGGRTISQLSGVVIEQPERFVNPVPPANPVLVRATPGPEKSLP
jgi:integrating conjugative element relaxase (TIGR03760 family)